MAFPIVQTTAESAETAVSTSHNVTMPSGITAGDLLVVILAGGGTNALQFSAEAGWTELLDENVTFGLHVWYRLADGTEPATVVFDSGATSRSASIAYRISGAENPGTQAPQLSTVATGTSNAPNPTTVTPTGGAKDYLFLTFFANNNEEADDDTWCNNAATNYSSLLQKTSGTGGTNVGATLACSQRTANVSSEDAVWPAGTTDVANSWRAFTLAVHPTSFSANDDGDAWWAGSWWSGARAAATTFATAAAFSAQLAGAIYQQDDPVSSGGPGLTATPVSSRAISGSVRYLPLGDDLPTPPLTPALPVDDPVVLPRIVLERPPPVFLSDDDLPVVAAPAFVDDDPGTWPRPRADNEQSIIAPWGYGGADEGLPAAVEEQDGPRLFLQVYERTNFTLYDDGGFPQPGAPPPIGVGGGAFLGSRVESGSVRYRITGDELPSAAAPQLQFDDDPAPTVSRQQGEQIIIPPWDYGGADDGITAPLGTIALEEYWFNPVRPAQWTPPPPRFHGDETPLLLKGPPVEDFGPPLPRPMVWTTRGVPPVDPGEWVTPPTPGWLDEDFPPPLPRPTEWMPAPPRFVGDETPLLKKGPPVEDYWFNPVRPTQWRPPPPAFLDDDLTFVVPPPTPFALFFDDESRPRWVFIDDSDGVQLFKDESKNVLE